jgi:hypothetical protein
MGPGTRPKLTNKSKKVSVLDKEQYQYQEGYIICAIHILPMDKLTKQTVKPVKVIYATACSV